MTAPTTRPAARPSARLPLYVRLRPDVCDASRFTGDLRALVNRHPAVPVRLAGLANGEFGLQVTFAVSPSATTTAGLAAVHDVCVDIFTAMRGYRPKYTGRPGEPERTAAKDLGDYTKPGVVSQDWLTAAGAAS